MRVPGEPKVDDLDPVAGPRHAQDVLRLQQKGAL